MPKGRQERKLYKHRANNESVKAVQFGKFQQSRFSAVYLHVHQGAVLSGPGLLQDLKDGHCAPVHDVHLTAADDQTGQIKVCGQHLLL